MPYEQIGNNEPVCIAEEVPFDIPENWIWTVLKSVGMTQTGNTPSKANIAYFGKDIPFISPADINNGIINYSNNGLSITGKEVARICSAQSIIQVYIGGSIGKATINTFDIAYNQQCNTISPYFVNVNICIMFLYHHIFIQ